jgi:hypothetical protein
MASRFSDGNTPRKRGTFQVRAFNSLGEFSEPREYPIAELSNGEFKSAREAVESARARIKANGGRYGYVSIDQHAGRQGSDWAKDLLSGKPRKWSFNAAMKLLSAVEDCERARALEKLCEANGTDERTLRHRYEDWRAAAIASASEKTGEVVNGIEATRGGAIPSDFDDFIGSQCDGQTMKIISDARYALITRQVVTSDRTSSQPYQCAMLYEPEAASAIAATIARYLVDKEMIFGTSRDRYKRVFPVLLELFAATDGEEPSFHTRCRFAFWSHFRRWDPGAVEEIERQMKALNENVG